MSFTETQSHTAGDTAAGDRRHEAPARRRSTETKASFKTTELIAYVVVVIGVLIASAVTDTSDFGAQEAWFYVSLLTIGYMISRGLAKSGSREPFDADADVSHRNR
jgi:hypothetical protein